MAIITEQNCPTLRFLKWNRSLLEHPLFKKWRNDGKRNSKLPYLAFAGESRALAAFCKSVVEGWEAVVTTCKADIWTASVAYQNAFEAASDSICKHRTELYNEMAGGVYSGTAIFATEGAPICLLYNIILKGAVDEVSEDGREGTFVKWDGYVVMVSGTRLLAGTLFDGRSMKEPVADAEPKLRDVLTEMNGSVDSALVFQVMDNLVFRKYANVTVREAREKAPKDQNAPYGDGKDGELIVKSNIPEQINRYDVNWFTETVRSAGFARKGFLGFRWKGPRGNRHRELVPVRPTWVKGYTRKAKKPLTPFTLKDLDPDE